MLLDHCDAARHRVFWGMDLLRHAVDEDLSLILGIQAVEDLHDRAFSGAVFAQQRNDLSGVDRKADVLVGCDLGKIL